MTWVKITKQKFDKILEYLKGARNFEKFGITINGDQYVKCGGRIVVKVHDKNIDHHGNIISKKYYILKEVYDKYEKEYGYDV